jgi:hypothetical protein
MVAYSFKDRFGALIENGTKTHTFRVVTPGRRHAKVGDELQLYTGMRTKACRLRKRTECVSSDHCLIEWTKSRALAHGDLWNVAIYLGGRSVKDVDRWIVADGFVNAADFRAYWEAAHPGIMSMQGICIGWKP